jgi:hypothetical protein
MITDSDLLDAIGIIAFVAFLAWVFLASVLLARAEAARTD